LKNAELETGDDYIDAEEVDERWAHFKRFKFRVLD
jgi:hypothetical protein